MIDFNIFNTILNNLFHDIQKIFTNPVNISVENKSIYKSNYNISNYTSLKYVYITVKEGKITNINNYSAIVILNNTKAKSELVTIAKEQYVYRPLVMSPYSTTTIYPLYPNILKEPAKITYVNRIVRVNIINT